MVTFKMHCFITMHSSGKKVLLLMSAYSAHPRCTSVGMHVLRRASIVYSVLRSPDVVVFIQVPHTLVMAYFSYGTYRLIRLRTH